MFGLRIQNTLHRSEHLGGHLGVRSKWARSPKSSPRGLWSQRPTGQTTLYAAQSLQKFGAPFSEGGRWRRRASRGASGARICIVG
eukprot:10033142-Alexandrium_andersonii.AAC.1